MKHSVNHVLQEQKKLITTKKEKGLTLIELLVAIAIATTIVVLALSGYQKTSDANKVGQMVKEVGSLNAGIRSAFASSSSYLGLNVNVADSLGIIPTTMKPNTGSNIIGSAYGDVTIGAAYSNRMFHITLATLPKEACTKLASQIQGGAEILQINGVTVKNTGNGDAEATLGEVTQRCNSASNNTVRGYYR